MKKNYLSTTLAFLFIFCVNQVFAEDTLVNKETAYLFNSLKALTKSDFTMFGMANGLTISYSGGPKHAFNDKSDCKDITGSHPAFIESDFMWYDDVTFIKQDTAALREAYNRGAITGYCFHLRGLHSNDFYAYKNNVLTSDKALVSEILASTDRETNASLNWYLNKLDNMVIPIIKKLGFPIIYRPFHEMTGNWFWWGTSTCTSTQYQAIWKLTVNYMRNKGVKNVLYAWAPDKSADFSTYPGDDYVDVIGYDGYDIGIESYHSTSFYVSNVGKLSDYAISHNKVFAITETGHGKYPGQHPDYWYEHVFKPIKKNAKAKHAAWVMTWYNSDWSNDKTGISWIPYKGIETKTNGQQAIDDFKAFFNDPRTIFMNDVPKLYYNTDSSAFVYPKEINFIVGDSINLIGGSKCNWFAETPTWKSSDESIATVNNGFVKTLKSGKVYITVTTPDAKSTDTCVINITANVSVNNVENNNIEIYPNPVNGNAIHFDFGLNFEAKHTTIYSVRGEELYSFATNSTKYEISNLHLASGVYVASIQTTNRKLNKTFIVK